MLSQLLTDSGIPVDENTGGGNKVGSPPEAELALTIPTVPIGDTALLPPTGSLVYRSSLLPLPQYSLLFPLHDVEHSFKSTFIDAVDSVLPHQHSRPYYLSLQYCHSCLTR